LLREAIREHQPTDIFQMLAHRASGSLGPMLQDRVHNAVVAFRAFDRDRSDDIGAVPLAMNMPHDLLVQVAQRLVAGSPDDAEMKVIVQLVLSGSIAAPCRLLHLPENSPDFL
jgi:hypothetical protein